METKLKFDLQQGSLEVQGNEPFVAKIWEEFKQQLVSITGKRQAKVKHSVSKDAEGRKTQITGRRKRASTKEKISIVKELNLSGDGNGPSLKEFYAQYNPKSALEKNLIFVYYMQQIRAFPNIGLSHIYTCYKDVRVKPPDNLRQSIADTSFRKGWIDTSSFDNIKVSTRGTDYLEHDLPKKETDLNTK